MPLDPRKIVQEARKVGLIEGHGLPNYTPRFVINALEGITEKVTIKVKLPAEAGIAPLPKPDRRSRAYRQRPKQPRKWLTKAEAIAKGYSL